MIKFSEFPYHRLDDSEMIGRMEEYAKKITEAKSFGEAFYLLIESDFIDRTFRSYATISEAGHTNDTRDSFYLEEERFFGTAKSRFDIAISKRNKAVLESPYKDDFKKRLGEEFFRSGALRQKIVSEAALAVMDEESELSEQYSVMMSQITCDVDGERMTLPQVAKLGNSSDRAVRAKYNKIAESAMMPLGPKLDDLYDKMVAKRHEIGKITGFDSYTDYCLCKHGRTGYGREELAAFAKSVKENIVPIAAKLVSEQSQRLGHEIKFYDEGTLFVGKEVEVKKELLPAYDKIFSALSPETKVFYDELRSREFFDLELREGKINGAYSNFVPLCNMPFIFETYNATAGAVKTFAHECGHGLHSFMHRGEAVFGTCSPSSDICETHAIAMEYFIWEQLPHIIDKEDIPLYCYRQLKDALQFIPYGTAVDVFQTTVYDNPDMTPEERRALWKDLESQFTPWRSYEEGLFLDEGRLWQRQIHVMKWPFYYIDYVLAQVTALQFWALDSENHELAWDKYMTFIKDSGRYSFSEMLERAGMNSPFEKNTLKDLADKVLAFLNTLNI